MLKKVIATISTLPICIVAVIGCGKVDPVQGDLLNYINKQVPNLVELDNKIITEYAAVTGKNYTDDATLAVKLKDVIIPAFDELIAKTKAIVPATEEVRKVHSKYMAAITEQHEAFKLLLQAVQNNDEKLVTTVNEKLTNAEKVAKGYLADLEALKKEHKVVNAKKD